MNGRINILLIFILIIFSLFLLTTAFNCKTNPNTDKCGNNTICSETGLCSCTQFYYGPNCDILLPDSKSVTIVETGISSGSIIGIITGLVVSFPVLLVAGLVLIYYLLKDRDY
jgi:hypothetical protein